MQPSSSGTNRPTHPLDWLVAYALNGGLPMLIFSLALVAGAIALQFTAREEEPQIVVPMVDVLVQSPGLSAQQVERQVAIPLEKLLAQIPGVEHVYTAAASGQTSVTLRFYVGEDREDAILNTYNKLYANQDQMPTVVSNWIVQPVEVDDVPIVMLALWSDDSKRSSDFELRRLADELSTALQAIDDTSEVQVVGGRPRTIRILPQPESLAARQSSASDIVRALQVSNVLQQAGTWTYGNQSLQLESGDVIRSVDELRQMVINVVDGAPVFLQDVANIVDGPAEPDHYSWISFSQQGLNRPQSAQSQPATSANHDQDGYPMVTISVAKKRGSNAVQVARDIHQQIAEWQQTLLPSHIHIEVLRDYGATANEKVSNLSASLAFAVVTVVIFIGVFLGWRPALVVGIAVPISYGITLALDMAFGYTINRVTLFALILSLGLLVDDPITGVDNIERFAGRRGSLRDNIIAAISEIKVPLVMSTLTIILAFIPLAFITGMMGPYMAPMAFNVPVSVITSTLVAFLVTPWLASKLLNKRAADPDTTHTDMPQECDQPDNTASESGLLRFYRALLTPLLNDRLKARWTLWAVLGLFIAAAMLPMLRLVPLKLLPFDNKNEVQIVIDMPESSSLEQTAAMAQRVAQKALQLHEVEAVASYVGLASPIDFNGMVRRYYQRRGPHLADLRVTLVDKSLRQHQSHAVVLRLRQQLAPLLADGNPSDHVSIKVVEVPPGPPVLSTLVAEVYGSALTPYTDLQQAASQVAARLQREPWVVEVDTTVLAEQQRLRFVTDKQKAALSGVSTLDIEQTLSMANAGQTVGHLQLPREAKPLPLELRLATTERSNTSDLLRLQVKGQPGLIQTQVGGDGISPALDAAPQPLVALGELGQFTSLAADQTIHRKDLQPVVYVMAELSGRTPAAVIADVNQDLGGTTPTSPDELSDWQQRTFLSLLPGPLNNPPGDGWQLASDIDVVWTGEGEWRITVAVFRDMGLAFLFALVGIFFVLKLQTQSVRLSLIIMSAIPLTIIGIMPGFWFLNQFGERQIAGAPEPVLFTATAMIGMIALAGIVVRNSLILVEFINQARATGLALREALIQAGAIRMRPILLTAGTTMLGNLIITLDPVFSGLALAIMFGIVASTLFTLLVVPVVYLLVFESSSAEVNP